jgi:hypothetical protein
MTARHHPAKSAQATRAVCTTETVMVPSDAAARLKIGSCRRMNPPKIRIALPRALLGLNFVNSVNSVQNRISGVIFPA